jgi:hypothetical protein
MVAESLFRGLFTCFFGGFRGRNVVIFQNEELALGFRIEIGFGVERKVKNE